MILLGLMTRRAKSLVSLLLLVGVITVFVAPFVNLEPTALRAARAATLAMLALAAAAVTASGLLGSQTFRPGMYLASQVPAPQPDVIDLDCVRLC